ncbi:MAG: type II secretion system F family protein [Planctomycetes bacterium]|nr:type II secretion system F family protein [Planctomycetota bacterium]
MKFLSKAYDKQGKLHKEIVEGENEAAVRDQLRKQGLFVTELTKQRASSQSHSSAKRSVSGGGKRLKNVSGFMRQLSLMLSTGTPLMEAMQAVQRQTPPGPFHDVIATMIEKISQGAALSETMAEYPQYFDPVARSLVRAGESGGRLAPMLQRLADLSRQQEKVRSSLLGAMVYPCLLICVAIAVLGVMVGFVLPRFEGLFQSLNAPLPPTTKIMLGFSEICREYWPALILGIAAIIVCTRMYLITEAGRKLIDRLLLGLPQLGAITRSFATARVARVLGVLLEGKVTLLESLELTRDSVTNSFYRDLIIDAEDAVAHGENISDVFERSGLIVPAVTEALRNGERTGQMAPVLNQMADVLDEDNEVLIKSLTSIIEPVILIVMGVAVGLVAMSLFMPLFDLTSMTQGGGGAE